MTTQSFAHCLYERKYKCALCCASSPCEGTQTKEKQTKNINHVWQCESIEWTLHLFWFVAHVAWRFTARARDCLKAVLSAFLSIPRVRVHSKLKPKTVQKTVNFSSSIACLRMPQGTQLALRTAGRVCIGNPQTRASIREKFRVSPFRVATSPKKIKHLLRTLLELCRTYSKVMSWQGLESNLTSKSELLPDAS